jgi:hypothetical protein
MARGQSRRAGSRTSGASKRHNPPPPVARLMVMSRRGTPQSPRQLSPLKLGMKARAASSNRDETPRTSTDSPTDDVNARAETLDHQPESKQRGLPRPARSSGRAADCRGDSPSRSTLARASLIVPNSHNRQPLPATKSSSFSAGKPRPLGDLCASSSSALIQPSKPQMTGMRR